MDRLLDQAFNIRPKRFNGMVEDTLATLGLPLVTRLPTGVETQSGDSQEVAPHPDGKKNEENYA